MSTPFAPKQLELEFARMCGHEAAERAAGRAGVDWKEVAYAALCDFTCSAGGRTFTIEEVRAAAKQVPPAPDGRAWGQVAMRARRDRKIVACGYAPTKSSNGSPKVLWRVGN